MKKFFFLYSVSKVLQTMPDVNHKELFFRFMPDGMYLNARNYEVEELAKEINEIICNPQRYFDFFKWLNYYSFHSTEENNYYEAVCGMCALLNNMTRRNERTVYHHIIKWWNEPKANDTVNMNDIIDENRTKPNDVFSFISNLFNLWSESEI